MIDLEAQLRSYGDAVELTHSPMPTRLLDMEWTADDIVAPTHPTGADRARRRPRMLAGVLTIAVVLAGAGAIMAIGTTLDTTQGTGDLEATGDTTGAVFADETVPLAADPVDPGAPLYVLPTGGSTVEGLGGPGVEAGSVSRGTNGPTTWVPFYRMVIGTPSGDGFRDLVSVTLGIGVPLANRSRPGDAPAAQVDTPSGPAEVDLFGSVAIVTQNRRGQWLLISSERDRVDAAVALLANITVNPDNSLEIRNIAPTQILEAVPLAPLDRYAFTYFDVRRPDRVETIAVETVSSPNTLVGAAATGGVASPTSVNGVDGWHVTRHDDDGEWNGVSWRATPGYSIAVSGIASLDEIMKVAESLEIVDESTWRAALPQAVERTR